MRRLAALLVFCATAAAAQTPPAATPADLDRLYAAARYRAAAEAIFAQRDEAAARAILAWAKARLQAGSPHLIGIAYGDLLWRIGDGQGNDSLRAEAGFVLISTILAVAADGAKCADTAAPDARIGQILAARAAPLHFLRGLPAEQRQRLRAEALALEQSLSLRRPEDVEICMAGPREIVRQLEAPGTVARDRPLQAGSATRTMEIEPGPGYRPQFLPPAQWHARQSQVRARFPALLDQLIPAN